MDYLLELLVFSFTSVQYNNNINNYSVSQFSRLAQPYQYQKQKIQRFCLESHLRKSCFNTRIPKMRNNPGKNNLTKWKLTTFYIFIVSFALTGTGASDEVRICTCFPIDSSSFAWKLRFPEKLWNRRNGKRKSLPKVSSRFICFIENCALQTLLTYIFPSYTHTLTGG